MTYFVPTRAGTRAYVSAVLLEGHFEVSLGRVHGHVLGRVAKSVYPSSIDTVEHTVNNTWELVTPPLGRLLLGCKWLFKVKRNLDRPVSHNKGVSQAIGMDYHETFSPIDKENIVRIMLVLAVPQKWKLR
ncbi:Integrase, catalytic core [Gossypium australe]|uniref:Integrase, catalytic core n=1 Tax=Gossypium australe TaxID=47621 RepID=A0A5B6WNA2_9ROSI|nr:Integrase, catalytic core [Gossypium australe]